MTQLAYYVNGIGVKTTVPTTGTFIASYFDKTVKIGGKDVKGVDRPIVYSNIKNAVGSLGWLVDNNTKATTTDVTITARTAFGYTADKVAYAIVVDGSQAEYSNGMSISNLADIMACLGVVDAVNMNGGASSSVTIRDASQKVWKSLSKPTTGKEASIGNGLAFVVKD
ncbi:phosphodiester glycosidase family protein [Pedobacter sp.]|uniref:phosphodiester glycosidase family protein n=1 Tax=Pedobacter sp. TaxID=1411316 RepID=UPI003D7F1C6B